MVLIQSSKSDFAGWVMQSGTHFWANAGTMRQIGISGRNDMKTYGLRKSYLRFTFRSALCLDICVFEKGKAKAGLSQSKICVL